MHLSRHITDPPSCWCGELLSDYSRFVCFFISSLSPSPARVMYKMSMKANLCNNVPEIGKRVKTSDSVWLDCKSVLEKLQQSVSCKISIYIVPDAWCNISMCRCQVGPVR